MSQDRNDIILLDSDSGTEHHGAMNGTTHKKPARPDHPADHTTSNGHTQGHGSSKRRLSIAHSQSPKAPKARSPSQQRPLTYAQWKKQWLEEAYLLESANILYHLLPENQIDYSSQLEKEPPLLPEESPEQTPEQTVLPSARSSSEEKSIEEKSSSEEDVRGKEREDTEEIEEEKSVEEDDIDKEIEEIEKQKSVEKNGDNETSNKSETSDSDAESDLIVAGYNDLSRPRPAANLLAEQSDSDIGSEEEYFIPHPDLNAPQPTTVGQLDSDESDSSSGYSDIVAERTTIGGEITRESIYNARYFLKEHGGQEFIRTYLPKTAGNNDIIRAIETLGYKINVDEMDKINLIWTLVRILGAVFKEVLKRRIRLSNFYLESHVLSKLESSERILVITGAGISTSLGIPDFRSSKGFYSRLNSLGLSDPQEVFDLDYFKADPSIFYSIAHMILPPANAYTPLHSFIKLLSEKNKLLRNYTQNIDNLEANAGIPSDQVIQCHGSFATATCITCGFQVDGSYIRKSIMEKTPSFCPRCIKKRIKLEQQDIDFPESFGVFKPDITFFGESLPKKFHDSIRDDLMNCDLVICVGTSLEVAPVADIVKKVLPSVPQVLINKDPLAHSAFDVIYLGYCDDVASHLCSKLNWKLKHKQFQSIVGPNNDNLLVNCLNEYEGLYSVINNTREREEQQKAKETQQHMTNDNEGRS